MGDEVVPYKIDVRGRASRTEYTSFGLDAANGMVSTVEDLARRFRKTHHGSRLDCGGIACSRGSWCRRSRSRSCC